MAEQADERGPVLLDSHAFLWALDDNDQLGANVRAALQSGREACLSSATVWELGIKAEIGRLSLPVPLRELVRRAVVDGGVRVLDVTPEHALRASELPMLHKDPFDRMLIAQAMTERLTLATRDGRIEGYGVATFT